MYAVAEPDPAANPPLNPTRTVLLPGAAASTRLLPAASQEQSAREYAGCAVCDAAADPFFQAFVICLTYSYADGRGIYASELA